MSALSTPSRSRNHDVLKPEDDLAEWTNRIKALQRQVDADDEAEQRRLEEEIAAARKARLRRSRGPESVEPPRISSETPSLARPSDSSHTVIGGETYQADASRRFMSGRPNVQPVAGAEKPLSQDSKVSQQKKSEPISLAAFMGGRASGPRLNKHAPQQDATDPTKFEQRTSIAAPHPVFGRGGIAMPGLVGQRPSAVRSQGGSQISVPTHSQALPITKRYDGKAVERAVASLETGGNERHSASRKTNGTQTVVTQSSRIGDYSAISHKADAQELVFPQVPSGKERSIPYHKPSTRERERAISTPGGAYSRKDTDRPSSRSSERKVSQFHGVGTDTPNINRNTSSSPSPSLVSSVNARHSPPSYAVKPVQKLPTGTSFLARPIQPEPRPVPQSNTIHSSILPSPAFMKPPAPKELTPSISRLQGRGFVQNMVKISSQFENPAPVSPTSKSRAPRKSSVLDRWQPVMASNSTPSPGSPKSVSTHSLATTNVPRPSPTEPVKKFLRTRASLPSISQGLTETSGAELERNVSLLRKMPPDGAPGLGSATTMAIFKPSPSPVETEFTNVDELGVRKGPASAEDVERTRTPGEFSPPSAKPLSHPTKDRAKKPRKVKDMQVAAKEQDKTSAVKLVRDYTPATTKIRTLATVSTAEVEATESRATHIPTAIDQRIEAVELPTTNKASETTLIEVPCEQTKRTSRAGRALPGLTALPAATSSGSLHKLRHDKPIHAAVRHPRATGAGSRPTAMDVAFVFTQQTDTASESKAEKRKSALDKYSSIMLPALKEEATPPASPIGTLPRTAIPPDGTRVDSAMPAASSGPPIVRLAHINYNLPDVNVDHLLESRSHIELSNPHIQTISVEVLNIIGSTATAISRDTNIFYDAEVLAVIHRYKSKLDGLVSTILWIWRGKQSQTNDKEERKIQDLARRYGTSPKWINHYSEPPQLVYLLGGQLAIRQGSRNRWTSENTTMHLVRQNSGVIYIDELDLSVKNLCSAFSYCLSVLDTIYVWHGCGSNRAERQAASEYAQTLVSEGQSPLELHEDDRNNDELFWMMLGGEDYAKADYWKWRKDASTTDPTVWRVQTDTDAVVTRVPLMPPATNFHEGVYIIDCIWEFFVLVGCKARGHRQDIGLGLVVASKMSKKLAPSRPFPPTLHVLVLPSQLPLDLRLNFRYLDEAFLNDGDVPDHMNILSATEASKHLQKTSWELTSLEDERMLPLGVDVSHVP